MTTEQRTDEQAEAPRPPSKEPTGTDDATADEHDLFKLAPLEALKLLSASVELLVHLTGDIPPTPPPTKPSNPQMSDMQAEKENIVRSRSEKNLARLRQQHEQERQVVLPKRRHDDEDDAHVHGGHGRHDDDRHDDDRHDDDRHGQPNARRQSRSQNGHVPPAAAAAHAGCQQDAERKDKQEIDGVYLRQRSPATPTAAAEIVPVPETAAETGSERPQRPPEPYVIVGADSQPLNLQHGAITRKFYSKKEPPITINQYLLRLHQFCPMSTAVYLATSLYIHRLAVEERAIPVTRRNAHRLVLAGLRVAMKALEDLSYPHAKIAKVGGVSDVELARLEISFCFLAGFELVVGEEPLYRHWETLRDGMGQKVPKMMDVSSMSIRRRPREVPATG
ncbi:Cyclin PHO80-like protein [Drechmeria coniospora]|uniref:Cyclin PHO80-like protein n=1 Tax=Drechmeria coniospora TaxID=98403 RepID=A0A151GH68_DRECN|nr:Cyclin PHO80-like protein [Drechmeria coniospora]KYK56416.1 Cyclin PHO80-like protein [Drechmeria coniospora]